MNAEETTLSVVAWVACPNNSETFETNSVEKSHVRSSLSGCPIVPDQLN
jgi:hypothetical protein